MRGLSAWFLLCSPVALLLRPTSVFRSSRVHVRCFGSPLVPGAVIARRSRSRSRTRRRCPLLHPGDTRQSSAPRPHCRWRLPSRTKKTTVPRLLSRHRRPPYPRRSRFLLLFSSVVRHARQTGSKRICSATIAHVNCSPPPPPCLRSHRSRQASSFLDKGTCLPVPKILLPVSHKLANPPPPPTEAVACLTLILSRLDCARLIPCSCSCCSPSNPFRRYLLPILCHSLPPTTNSPPFGLRANVG